MFCSRCGQQQASESVRFCSRCGFKLGAIEEGLGKRLMMMAMYFVLAMSAIIGWGSMTTGPNYMQIRLIITIIAAITFYLVFSGDLRHIFHTLFVQNIEQRKQIVPTSEGAALPPARSIPVPPLGSYRVNTAEMVQPPSVTERTTISLDKTKH